MSQLHQSSDSLLMVLLLPTCERVLHLTYPLHHHPGVVLPYARRTLVVCASMLQYVVVYLAVRLRQGPDYSDRVVAHLAL